MQNVRYAPAAGVSPRPAGTSSNGDNTVTRNLSLFEGFGVELEYMIVEGASLSVSPIADRLLEQFGGPRASDVERGAISWSNELVAHVVELKTTSPAPTLSGLDEQFADNVRVINEALASHQAKLMPTAMHPWMVPDGETRLWPGDYSETYAMFDRIFNCKGHGWANLQSVHLNLPFAGDDEFARLHAAIRLVLPILPALSASSPIVEERRTGLLDTRLDVYRTNCRAIPSVTGRVIPEPVFSRADYEEQILKRMYADIAPQDPNGVVQHEWLNARGAIARFDRNAIEIRVLDVQECPRADLAILRLVVAVLRALVAERWCNLAEQQSWQVDPLVNLFLAAIRDAERTPVEDRAYLRLFGVNEPCTAGELWRRIASDLGDPELLADYALARILRDGPLARRLLTSLGEADRYSRDRLATTYAQLCECLANNELFP